MTPSAVTPSGGYLYNLGLTSATSMVTAGGKLFIATGNSVQIRALTGALIATVTGTTGVTDLVASPDGSAVYAADNGASAITMISVATYAKTSYPVGSCPTYLAWSSGRVFFSYGCSGSPISIASIDPANDGQVAASGITTSLETPPLLAAVDGRLIASVLRSTILHSYAVSGATLTETASVNYNSEITDLAISPDGSTVGATEEAPYGVAQFDAETLATKADVETGPYTEAMAYGHNHLLAAGLTSSYTASMQIYDTTSGAEVSAIAPHMPSGGVPWTLANTLTFGPDAAGHQDNLVYGLATDVQSGVYLEIAPTGPLSIAHMTLGLSSPAAYGKPLVVSVTFPGHANVALTLKVLPNSGSPIYVPVRTNQWGVATASIKVNFTGRIYAYYGGDLLTRHEAPTASAIHAFTVPTRMTVSMLGAYKTSGGVLYYHSGLNVHLHVLVGPPHVRTLSVLLQGFEGGKWVSRAAATFTTNQWGTVDLYLSNGAPNLLYRTLVSTPTSVFNLGSHGTGAAFKLG